MQAVFLNWDSDFFKRKVFKLEIMGEFDRDILLKILSDSDGDLFYIFSDKANEGLIAVGARLVDTKLVFTKRINDNIVPEIDKDIKAYDDEETGDLLNLAFLSGTYSRFKIDDAIKFKFKDMYELWLNRSLNKNIADEVFIYKTGNKISGFITVKNDNNIGVIGLIAVDENEQGKRIGKRLINKVEHWCLSHKIPWLDVATQKANVSACNFYNRCGFTIKTENFIYHYHRS